MPTRSPFSLLEVEGERLRFSCKVPVLVLFLFLVEVLVPIHLPILAPGSQLPTRLQSGAEDRVGGARRMRDDERETQQGATYIGPMYVGA